MSFIINNSLIKICLQEISEKTLRISVLPAGESVKDVFSTIDLSDREWMEPDIALNGNDGRTELKAGNFTVHIDENPIKITVLRQEHLIQVLEFSGENGEVTFPLGNGSLFGLGHGFRQQMNRRGANYDLRIHGQILGLLENYSAVAPTPYIISTEGWALYFHQPWKGEIQLSGDMGCFRKYMEAYCDIFVVACDEPLDAPKEYYAFTGMPPMPPKYALGYQQSYRTLVHDGINYVEKTARYMREHQIPCDLLIYLGSGYCDYGWNIQNGDFEWNPVAFPQPEKTMKELHNMGYKVSMHVTRCYHGLHGSIHEEDVSPLEYDHTKNYWERHKKLYETVQNEAWWPDDGDGVDLDQLLCRYKMYYEGSLALNPDIRPLQMQRNTFPGANKWGGITWSGDILSEWETLKNQIPLGLNVALSCTPFWGTDTGGFYCTKEFDGELYMRWMEYSAFTPFFRSHGRPSFLHNPWGWSVFHSPDEIPLELCPGMTHDAPPAGDILPDERVEPLCRKFIELRYSLMPYIYNLSHEACSKGIPVMRPLWCYYTEDEKAIFTDSEYFFGESLLVAPVTAKGAKTWEVYLPAGEWYNYWTGQKITGGCTITVNAPLEEIPLFVPTGGILAKAPIVQFIDTERKETFDPLTIEIYTGKDGKYELYEDDGISMGYTRGEYTMTYIHWRETEEEISITGVSTLFPGQRRMIEVCLMPERKYRQIEICYE